MVYLGLPIKNGDFPWLCWITRCIYIYIYIYIYINISLFKWQMFLVTYGSWLVYLAHWWPKKSCITLPSCNWSIFSNPITHHDFPISMVPMMWNLLPIHHGFVERGAVEKMNGSAIFHHLPMISHDLLWSARPNHLASFTFPSSSSGKQRFDECRWDSFRTKLDMKESMDVHGFCSL